MQLSALVLRACNTQVISWAANFCSLLSREVTSVAGHYKGRRNKNVLGFLGAKARRTQWRLSDTLSLEELCYRGWECKSLLAGSGCRKVHRLQRHLLSWLLVVAEDNFTVSHVSLHLIPCKCLEIKDKPIGPCSLDVGKASKCIILSHRVGPWCP